MNFIPTFYPKVKYLIIFARLLSTVTSQKVLVKFWYDNQIESQATNLNISSGISTQSISDADWQNIWGQASIDKLWCDQRGSVITNLNAQFASNRVFYLKFTIASNGVLDLNGNTFNAVLNANPPQSNILFKLEIDYSGNLNILNISYS